LWGTEGSDSNKNLHTTGTSQEIKKKTEVFRGGVNTRFMLGGMSPESVPAEIEGRSKAWRTVGGAGGGAGGLARRSLGVLGGLVAGVGSSELKRGWNWAGEVLSGKPRKNVNLPHKGGLLRFQATLAL